MNAPEVLPRVPFPKPDVVRMAYGREYTKGRERIERAITVARSNPAFFDAEIEIDAPSYCEFSLIGIVRAFDHAHAPDRFRNQRIDISITLAMNM